MPSTLPPCPILEGILWRVLEAAASKIDKEWVTVDVVQLADSLELISSNLCAGDPEMWTFTLRDAATALRQCRWIPVGERLPEEGAAVLVWMADLPHAEHGMDIGSYMTSHWGVSWMVSDGRSAFPTHWMPLPQPPKDDSCL